MMGLANTTPETIGPGARLVLWVHSLFVLGMGLSSTFVNIYLWKISQDLALIARYNLYHFSALGITFIVAGKLAETRDRTDALRVGVFLHGVFFVMVLLVGDEAARAVPALGTLLGVASGFYWLGNHVLTFDLTNEANIDRFSGLFTLYASLSGTISPFLAGWIISLFPGNSGYQMVFGISLALFTLCTVVSLKLFSRASDGEFTLGPVFSITRNPEWRHVMVVALLNGVRGGVYSFLIGLLVFMWSQRELVVGTFSLLTGFLTMASCWIAGRYIRRHNRAPALWWSSIATTVSVIALALSPGFWGLAVFGFLEAVFTPFYGISFGAVNFRVIGADPESDLLRAEYMTARELPLNLGRALGILIFLWATPYFHRPEALSAVILILGLAPVAGWPYLKRLAR